MQLDEETKFLTWKMLHQLERMMCSRVSDLRLEQCKRGWRISILAKISLAEPEQDLFARFLKWKIAVHVILAYTLMGLGLVNKPID